jgi:branched-subunit amino acid aminotransferase/4-amino-4-deoxychorismate lyase
VVERVIAGGKPGPITRKLRAAYLQALEGLIQED